jgi:hypothetical protein
MAEVQEPEKNKEVEKNKEMDEQEMVQVVQDYAKKLRESFAAQKEKNDEEELFTYKCRAECPADAEKLRKRCKRRLGNVRDFSVVVDPELGQAEITFSCSVPQYRIHRLLQIDRITNCHVMHETLNLASQYTGKRNYSMSRC